MTLCHRPCPKDGAIKTADLDNRWSDNNVHFELGSIYNMILGEQQVC